MYIWNAIGVSTATTGVMSQLLSFPSSFPSPVISFAPGKAEARHQSPVVLSLRPFLVSELSSIHHFVSSEAGL